ncbi:MAG: HAD family hydrolase [Oceanipulchritudo sp.]
MHFYLKKASHLIEHTRNHSRRLHPKPTGEEPRLQPFPGIKAVIFDIYGTLFISGSGDISLAEEEDRSPAIAGALATAGYRILSPQAPWSDHLLDCIRKFRELRKVDGIAFPEVRIEEVWAAFIGEATAMGWLEGDGDIRLAIVDHECRVNPAWPMPGLGEILGWIRSRGLLLGIVSNAQFYTPLLFPALLGCRLEELGFREDCSVWSYVEREGKPSIRLYQLLAERLAERDILPRQVLYIGNDMRNDIRPARETGFATALFAGDARSLRWRREDPRCRDLQPDLVLTNLRQIEQVLA